jgi:hypothetical protein
MERQHGYLHKKLFCIGAVLFCFLLLLPVLRLLPMGVQAQLSTDTNREDYEPRIVAFFETLSRGNPTSAFYELLRSSPLGTPEASEHVAELQRRVIELQSPSEFGDILAWERLEVKRVGTNVSIARYVLMYDRYPVVWTFMFYRKPLPATSTTVPSSTGSNPWVLVELHFNTDMKSML